MQSILPSNEHALDRVFRVVLGIALISPVFLMEQSTAYIIAAVAGAVFLLTGLIGSCPIYTMLGVSTKSKSA